MSNEAPHLPPEQLTDPDQSIGPAQANLALSHELTGAEQLAGSLVVVAKEHGPAGVGDYLNDVLADTEGQVTPGERQSALKLLAGEQRKALRENAIVVGEYMVESMSARNNSTHEEVGDNGHVAKRIAEELIEEHRVQIGRHFRDGVDTRRAARGHEDLEHSVRKGLGVVQEFGEMMHSWRRGNLAAVEGFAIDSQRLLNHERALNEAEKTTDPAYDGEPVDISGVIDKAVKQEVSTKLNEAVLQAREEGADPQEAVLKILLEDKPDDVSTDELKALRAFAGHYESFAAVEASRIQSEADKVGHALQSFMRRGQEDYTYARTIDEAQDVYRRQSQALQHAVTEANGIAPHAMNILKTERGDLLRLQLYLEQARSNEVKTTS